MHSGLRLDYLDTETFCSSTTAKLGLLGIGLRLNNSLHHAIKTEIIQRLARDRGHQTQVIGHGQMETFSRPSPVAVKD